MKPNFIDVLLIAVIETTLAQLEKDNAKLRDQAAGYDRLKAENQRLRGLDSYYGSIERQNEELKQQLLELGRKNIALAAEAESAAHLEEALDKANRRVDELEVALTLMRLPAASMSNVIALIQEQAA